MRWREGPPHLALNPPSFVFVSFLSFWVFLFWRVSGNKPSLFVCCFVFLLSFLSLLLIETTCLPPRKRAFFFIFECLPLFLLSFFWPPPFSIALYLSLSSSFLSFFLPVFFFVFFCFLAFVSLFPFLSSLLTFHEKNNIKILNYKGFLHQVFLFFGFLSCFLFKIPFYCLCFFPILGYVFCSTSLFLVSKNPN